VSPAAEKVSQGTSPALAAKTTDPRRQPAFSATAEAQEIPASPV